MLLHCSILWVHPASYVARSHNAWKWKSNLQILLEGDKLWTYKFKPAVTQVVQGWLVLSSGEVNHCVLSLVCNLHFHRLFASKESSFIMKIERNSILRKKLHCSWYFPYSSVLKAYKNRMDFCCEFVLQHT